jgi:hypothetical protein
MFRFVIISHQFVLKTVGATGAETTRPLISMELSRSSGQQNAEEFKSRRLSA